MSTPHFALFEQLAQERMAQAPALPDQDQTDEEARHPTFEFDAFIAEFGDAGLQAITRFRVEEFYEIYDVVSVSLEVHGMGRRGMDSKSKLFVLLAWLTSGLTYLRLGLELGIAKTIVSEVVHTTANAIKEAIIAAFLPRHNTDPQANCDLAFPDFPDAYAAVDASVVAIWKPLVDQKLYYSGKHKFHCVKVQALVRPNGLCVHISDVFKGSIHDKRLFDVSQVIDFLTETVPGRHVRHLPFLADSGYQGLQRHYPVVLPHKSPRNGELSEEEKFLWDVERVIWIDPWIV
jgi:hypothetical protein